jgi:aspartate racemase
MVSKIVGILGGMGTLSTIELMRKIYLRTEVETEQQHLRLLIDNRPQIPDRTNFILGLGPSPLPHLRESAQLLEKWGAEFIAIACNTAHLFYNDITEAVKIPILNMLSILNAYLTKQQSAGCRIGLLTTTGALNSRLFQTYLPTYQLIVPRQSIQNKYVMEAVYGKHGVKTSNVSQHNKSCLRKAIEDLEKDAPDLIIAGCTEIGLILQEMKVGIQILNPLDILADEIVFQAQAT